MPAAAYIESY